jgi:hypothetical protein
VVRGGWDSRAESVQDLAGGGTDVAQMLDHVHDDPGWLLARIIREDFVFAHNRLQERFWRSGGPRRDLGRTVSTRCSRTLSLDKLGTLALP